ncbi:MAG: hypothetical protein EBX18_01640, partial [Actinobacteria bacterium]|nr:hypothetical protein [Actinomycetota bacterium]
RTVDFGVHQFDWSLPFMNEYERLGQQWLTRFPFSAKFGARVTKPNGDEYFLPILGNGELKVALGLQQLVNQDLVQAGIYEFPRLYLIRIPRGTSELVIDYTFRDDENQIPPDEAPVSRGPYATLKVGKPQRAEEILSYAKVQMRGWAFSQSLGTVPTAVAAFDTNGDEIARTVMSERPDVAAYFKKPSVVNSGFTVVATPESVSIYWHSSSRPLVRSSFWLCSGWCCGRLGKMFLSLQDWAWLVGSVSMALGIFSHRFLESSF